MPSKFPVEEAAKLLDPEREKWQSLSSFLKVTKPKKEEKWADLGCGPGYFTLPLAQHLETVFALDCQEKMLEICRQRIKKEKLHNVFLILSGDRHFPFASDTLDAVLCANVFHELTAKETLFSGIQKALKEKGRLYLIDWHYQESPVGPPLEERVPEEKVISFLKQNRWQKIKSYPLYPYHYFLEAKKF